MLNTVIFPRIHFYEIDDQTWFPQFLRARIQACLTFLWSFTAPFPGCIHTPSTAVVSLLRDVFRTSISSYTFVDFCAGAGGPTPIIERHLNADLRRDGQAEIDFVLTDLWPNVPAWRELAKRSGGRVRWVESQVDAGNAPGKDVLMGVGIDDDQHPRGEKVDVKEKKIFRTFCLAFHHFDDDGAGRIVRDAILNSDGFGVFELQNRTLMGLFQVFCIGPILTFWSPFVPQFHNWLHLFFTYVIPILPFVMVADGYVSALRTREPEEITAIVERVTTPEERRGWTFEGGEMVYAAPVGRLHWYIARKNV